MLVLVLILLFSVGLEFAAIFNHGLIRKVLAIIAIIAISDISINIFALRPAAWSIAVLYISIFRLVNLIKLIDEHRERDNLRASVARASIYLVSLQIADLIITFAIHRFAFTNNQSFEVFAVIELVGLIIVTASLVRTLAKTRPSLREFNIEESRLPTVSVAIPARNETEDLEDCLLSLIASDYPKLEIVVLDDCSQFNRTPEIIRQFAHDGVIFLAGKQPNDNWTAKNWAYEELAAKANGDILLFCGVDLRVDKSAIRKMIELKIKKNKEMLSFMPVNKNAVGLKASLIQPMRYLWELGLPRRSFNRPPVLSTCWLIEAKVLNKLGGFGGVSRSIIPERLFARQIASETDGYSFVCEGQEIGIISQKSFEEQKSTAIRTRYPMLRQRIENVCVVGFMEVVLFILPVGLLIYGLVESCITLSLLSALNIVITSVITYKVTKLTYGLSLYTSLLIYPVIYLYDKWLIVYSMYKYEFSEVIWKGRNVCIPASHVQSSQ